MKKQNFIILSLLLFLGVYSCRTWDEDFNTNPTKANVGSELDASVFLGTIIDNLAGYEKSIIDRILPLCEYIGKDRSLSQGNRHRSWHDFDGNVWNNSYDANSNIKSMRTLAQSSNDLSLVAIADILECYAMANLNLFHGPVPYFYPISYDNDTATSYPYDQQDLVFTNILSKLKSASNLIDSNDAGFDDSFDYIYEGDVQKWKKLANTLRIRFALYMYNASKSEASTVIQEIVSNPDQYPVFESNDDNFQINYYGSTERTSPWYGRAQGLLDNAPLSNVFVERLLSLKDPRIYIYGRPVLNDYIHEDADLYLVPTNIGEDKYIGHLYGITTGNGDATKWNGGIQYASRIGEQFISAKWNEDIANFEHDGSDIDKPLVLGTYDEMLFNLAEAAKRGIIPGGDQTARDYYEAAIKASFDRFGCAFAGYSAYDGAYDTEGLASADAYMAQQQVSWDGGRDHKLLIAEQKWIASFALGYEPYYDHKRTMLPPLRSSHNAASYESSGSGTAFPSRGAYPDEEAGENSVEYLTARASLYNIAITGDDNRNEALMWLLDNDDSPSLEMPTFQEPMDDDGEYPGGDNFKTWYDSNWKSMFWWENE